MTVKENIAILLVMFCLVGCHRELHDPLLRQQLTTLVANLGHAATPQANVAAEKQAIDDLDAVLSVNSSKLSKMQKEKIEAAIKLLRKSVDGYAVFWSNGTDVPLKTKAFSNYVSGQFDAKETISEVAGTF